MRKVRSVFALAALAAAFGLLVAVPADQSRAAEKAKEHTPEELAKQEKAAERANDVGTAYALIELARREEAKNPIAMLTAVELLAAAGPGKQVKPGSEEAKAVEGDGKVQEPGNFYDGLRA